MSSSSRRQHVEPQQHAPHLSGIQLARDGYPYRTVHLPINRSRHCLHCARHAFTYLAGPYLVVSLISHFDHWTTRFGLSQKNLRGYATRLPPTWWDVQKTKSPFTRKTASCTGRSTFQLGRPLRRATARSQEFLGRKYSSWWFVTLWPFVLATGLDLGLAAKPAGRLAAGLAPNPPIDLPMDLPVDLVPDLPMELLCYWVGHVACPSTSSWICQRTRQRTCPLICLLFCLRTCRWTCCQTRWLTCLRTCPEVCNRTCHLILFVAWLVIWTATFPYECYRE